jgi:hypothetical protein
VETAFSRNDNRVVADRGAQSGVWVGRVQPERNPTTVRMGCRDGGFTPTHGRSVGVRIRDLPITPEKILRALQDKENEP